MADQIKSRYDKKPVRIQGVKRTNVSQPQTRENARDYVTIDLCFAPDWFRGWHEFSRPIKERGEANQGTPRPRSLPVTKIDKRMNI